MCLECPEGVLSTNCTRRGADPESRTRHLPSWCRREKSDEPAESAGAVDQDVYADAACSCALGIDIAGAASGGRLEEVERSSGFHAGDALFGEGPTFTPHRPQAPPPGARGDGGPLAMRRRLILAMADPAAMGPERPFGANVNPARALFDFLHESSRSWNGDPRAPGEPRFAAGVRALLNRLRASDIGLTVSDATRLRTTQAPVGYVDIHSGQDFTICIFVLSKGSKIPLHDHPHMFVYGRALFGRLHVTSYTHREPLSDADRGDATGPGYWGTLHQDDILGPKPANFELTPEIGNLHEVVALEDSAFFDITAPPYEDDEGRPCNYYVAGRADAHGRYKLKPWDYPGLAAMSIPYRGPPYRPIV
mmetsp:Transcript_106633/g.306765  ORF Transcript_106633/g.306765 Transcript_106633/m.306765 type:complete len:364 (-) Transcript_106633:20-1111(-)